MVTWGVVEFALHTLRPNTIQREDQIVEVFRKASDIIWENHKQLQLDASSLSNTLQKADASSYPTIINGLFQRNSNSNRDWLLVRDGEAQWWSQNLTMAVVGAMLDATSVLHSNNEGVYVMASAKWESNGSNWQLLGSSKVFKISVQNSKFGDVYEASIPKLTSMDPAPFYLEGSPDLLPFDHRFSIIRINDDFTTGHLALSTLDPGVRNFVNPGWVYGFRTLFFVIIAFSAWMILNLVVSEKSEFFKIASQVVFILACGWFTVLLDIVQFWSGLNVVDSLFQDATLTITLVQYAWISIVFLIASRYLVLYFERERFFDHGTRFNKTSIVLFSVGSIIGAVFWIITLYYNELSNLNWTQVINSPTRFSSISVVGFIWFVLVATTFKLIAGLLQFIQKSVKYQVSWIIQILITGHIYLFTILFILNYTSGGFDLIKSGWMLLVLPIGILILYKFMDSETSKDSIFLKTIKLSLFPMLVAYPLYLYDSIETLQLIQIIPSITGIWIRSLICSFLVISITSSGNAEERWLINLSFGKLFKGHLETRLALTTLLIILVHFLTTPVAQIISKAEIEQNYTHFLINQSNHHPVKGSYEPGLLGLPVFKSWVVTARPDFDDMLDYQVFTSAISNTTINSLSWSTQSNDSPPILRLYKASSSDNSVENFQILATTVDSYPRIFGRLSAIISSLSILAVLSIHFFVGIVRKRSGSSNASPI